MYRFGIYAISTLFILSFFSSPLSAKPAQTNDKEQVELRVARLGLIEGSVKVLRISDDDWVDGMINMPLMAGDQIYTEPGGRAEIELEDGATLWLDSNTLMKFTFLDSGLEQVEIRKGTLSIGTRVWEYDRPPLQVKGDYFTTDVMEHTKARYDVKEEGAALINVWRGEVRAVRNQESHFRVQKGTALVVRTPDPNSYTIRPSSKPDEFDHWVDIRDSIHSSSQSQEYISQRIAGYSDLDRYGQWVHVKDYGKVWRPYITVSDWAPYRYGYWSSRKPYGRVWVSHEPWGWVPYHYGRWVYVDHYNWVWVPKDVYVVHHHYRRPIWYPHLVSFAYADHGSYFHFSVGYGHYRHRGHYVGWFPLGPRDYYYGHYRHRYAYVDRSDHYYDYRGAYIDNSVTNIDNSVTNINYQNSNVQNAITVVPRDEFAPQKAARETQTKQFASATLPRQNLNNVRVGRDAVDNLPDPNPGAGGSERESRIRLTREQEPSLPRPSGQNTLASSNRPSQEAERGVQTQSSRGNTEFQTSSVPSVSQRRDSGNSNSRAERSVSARGSQTTTSESPRSSQGQKSARSSSTSISPANSSTPNTEAPRSSVASERDERSNRYSSLSPSASSSSRNSDTTTRPQRPTSVSPSRGSDNNSQPSVSASRSNNQTYTPYNRNERLQSNNRPVSRPRSSNLGSQPRTSQSTQPSQIQSSPSRSSQSSQIQSSPSRSNSSQSGSRPTSNGLYQRSPSRNSTYQSPNTSTNPSRSSIYRVPSRNSNSDQSVRQSSPSRSSTYEVPRSSNSRSRSPEVITPSRSGNDSRSYRPSSASRSSNRVYNTQPSRSSDNSSVRSYSPSRSTSPNRSNSSYAPNRSSSRTYSTNISPSRGSSRYYSSGSRSPSSKSYSTSPSQRSTRSYSPSRSNSSSRIEIPSRSSSSSPSFSTSRSSSPSRSYSSPSRSSSSTRSYSSPSRSSSSSRSYSPSRSSSSSRSFSPSRSSGSSRSYSSSSSRSSSRSYSAPRSSGSSSSPRSAAPRASSRTSSPR